MSLLLPITGIILFFLIKKFMFSVDGGKAMWSGILELPVDVNLVGFMLAVAATSQIAPGDELASIGIMTSIILMALSTIVWKYSCTLISERDGAPYIHNGKLLILLVSANIFLAVAAIATPVYIMGVKI